MNKVVHAAKELQPVVEAVRRIDAMRGKTAKELKVMFRELKAQADQDLKDLQTARKPRTIRDFLRFMFRRK